MKRLLALFCLALCFGPAAPAQEPAKSPTLYFHHHSFFEIHSSAGTVIAIDPHAIEAYAGNPPPKIKADVVLLSHSHSDHTRVAARIENFKQAKIIPGYKGNASNLKWNLVDEKFKDVHIRSYGSYHDEEQGMKYGINTIFVIEVDGWKIAHLGDLGHLLSSKQIKEIGEVDVLMVPVGGIYSLNGSQANKLVKAMDVKEYILPMHYGTPQLQDTLTPDEFLEPWPQKQIARDKGNKLALNRDPQRPRPLVVLLHQEEKK
jgi:L-ascorbate metabolism protein UlaG (beta-lactamase superfamily)